MNDQFLKIRKGYLAWAMLMNTGVVWFGLINLTELTTISITFMSAVLALLNIPVPFFFHDSRVAEENKYLKSVMGEMKMEAREDRLL